MSQQIFHALCNKSSTGRILGVKPSQIARLEPVSNAIMIEFKDGSTQYVSPSEYIADFVNLRVEKSKELIAIQVKENRFTVYNPGNDHVYVVAIDNKVPACPCEDYKRSKEIFQNQVACKHVYAALRQLGYDNLRDYVETEAKTQIGV